MYKNKYKIRNRRWQKTPKGKIEKESDNEKIKMQRNCHDTKNVRHLSTR
jgi:hypothetical protein